MPGARPTLLAFRMRQSVRCAGWRSILTAGIKKTKMSSSEASANEYGTRDRFYRRRGGGLYRCDQLCGMAFGATEQ
jgi:hypothetical protein